ncbi:MAG: hypothetical protein K9N05_06065 [Candidatus Marinimicrobia bacterium]|nr:hypothetical protein [Candidatus Neomarinimicrobiota bacterium]
MQKSNYEVFMVLGAIWLIVGLIVYKNASLWPIGAIFFIVGLVGFIVKTKKSDQKNDNDSDQ